MVIARLPIGLVVWWVRESVALRCLILAYWGYLDGLPGTAIFLLYLANTIYKRTIAYRATEDNAFPPYTIDKGRKAWAGGNLRNMDGRNLTRLSTYLL